MNKGIAVCVVALFLLQIALFPVSPAPTEASLQEVNETTHTSGQPSFTLKTYDTSFQFNSVDRGENFYCAVANDGQVKCWGVNNMNQHGAGVASPAELFPQSTGTLGVGRTAVAVSAGHEHGCAILDNGKLRCWGHGGFGKLGTGSTSMQVRPTPVFLPIGLDTISVAAGTAHTCAVVSDGTVFCWGQAYDSQLGNTTWGRSPSHDSMSPIRTDAFTTTSPAVSVSAGRTHTCALLGNGEVYCWGGGGGHVTIGDGSTTEVNTPTKVSAFGNNRTAVQISAGEIHTCARLNDGSVSCWGYNEWGQLGDGTTTRRHAPVDVEPFGGNRTAVDISAGYYHTCALLDDGNVSCWGVNNEGQLGIGNLTDMHTPTDVNHLGLNRTVTSIHAGTFESCAGLDDGSLSCWGKNNLGQLGDGTVINRWIPGDYSQRTFEPESQNEVVEESQSSVGLYGEILDDFDPTTVQVTVEVPQGMVFNNTNLRIEGQPTYTTQYAWNASISDANKTKNGTYTLAVLPDTDLDGIPNGMDLDDDGDGAPDVLDACPTQGGNSTLDVQACPDADGDGMSDRGDPFPLDGTQSSDSDQDGYGDNASGNLPDACVFEYGSSTRNSEYGCPDSDGDGWADQSDAFPDDLSQWNDTDDDGYGDSIIGFEGDDCSNTYGNSTVDRYGCLDTDGDGTSDKNDAFPLNPSQQTDRDGDGYGDNQSSGATQVDWFPSDTTQWNDTDGDGHGDNPGGTAADRFPDDPSRWRDSDRDGVADEDDAFPDDATQNADTDGDGYGDDLNGNRGDAFPTDSGEWSDTDADGVGNNADAFPFDPSQNSDADGDGFGDDPRGSGADRFPNDATQWSDIDGDGYGDNAEGTDPDAFIADPTQWSDADGDGYGDNPTGRQADAFPNDPTQWEDQDGDGFGDNQSGANPDPYLFDFDNDGYNDSIDPLPKLASPGDLDNDGTPDLEDAFPEDFREWADSDGDEEGDNADPDDDNDGWSDAEEIRQGTDPYSSASQPVDSFEVVIPGTQVGLGAWDLIGMFGGIPLFFWIMFGFATRNGRTARFEDELRAAQTRDELEHVALRWEFMLMLRMLGPHQGIRLERLRAELDDRFEGRGQRLSRLEQHGADQTDLVVEDMKAEDEDASAKTDLVDKQVVENPSSSLGDRIPAIEEKPAQVADGFEWIEHDGQKWYRAEDSIEPWTIWNE